MKPKKLKDLVLFGQIEKALEERYKQGEEMKIHLEKPNKILYIWIYKLPTETPDNYYSIGVYSSIEDLEKQQNPINQGSILNIDDINNFLMELV